MYSLFLLVGLTWIPNGSRTKCWKSLNVSYEQCWKPCVILLYILVGSKGSQNGSQYIIPNEPGSITSYKNHSRIFSQYNHVYIIISHSIFSKWVMIILNHSTSYNPNIPKLQRNTWFIQYHISYSCTPGSHIIMPFSCSTHFGVILSPFFGQLPSTKTSMEPLPSNDSAQMLFFTSLGLGSVWSSRTSAVALDFLNGKFTGKNVEKPEKPCGNDIFFRS